MPQLLALLLQLALAQIRSQIEHQITGAQASSPPEHQWEQCHQQLHVEPFRSYICLQHLLQKLDFTGDEQPLLLGTQYLLLQLVPLAAYEVN
jgi:hypothetical protein